MTDAAPPAVVEVFSGSPPRAAFDLRHEVFVVEQGIAPAMEYDGLDADADHAVLFDPAGRAVATARLLDPGVTRAPHERPSEPVGVIGRVAVSAAQRGRGLGRLVTSALEARARDRGLVSVELHAQAYVADFYARQGYRTFGEPDVVAGIDHVWMRRELLPGLRRVRDPDGPALERLIGAVWSEYPGCVLDVDAEEPWLRAPGSAYERRGEEPGRAMWVIPANPHDPASEVLACVAVREHPPVVGVPAPTPAEPAVPARGSGGELKSLYVSAAARRRGFGEALVRRAEREARRWGAEHLVLWTDTRFTDAHRLYARLGYTPTGRTRDLHDLSATTELEFHRDLPAGWRERTTAVSES